MHEVIDAVADADGDEIEVGIYPGGEILLRIAGPSYTGGSVVALASDSEIERFSKAWNEALLRREHARAAVAGQPS